MALGINLQEFVSVQKRSWRGGEKIVSAFRHTSTKLSTVYRTAKAI
jgi:hypothetical protein